VEPVTEGAFAKVISAIREAPAVAALKAELAADPVFPEPLRSYLGGDVDKLRWRRLGFSAKHLPIATRDGRSSVRLLRIPAGQPVPEHGHGGPELTLVLKGCLVDGEQRFHRGDVECTDETVEHQPSAGPEEDCVCLAVTDAPLRFKSRIARLAQPFLRI
jgi:putative transcriptional regulator